MLSESGSESIEEKATVQAWHNQIRATPASPYHLPFITGAGRMFVSEMS